MISTVNDKLCLELPAPWHLTSHPTDTGHHPNQMMLMMMRQHNLCCYLSTCNVSEETRATQESSPIVTNQLFQGRSVHSGGSITCFSGATWWFNSEKTLPESRSHTRTVQYVLLILGRSFGLWSLYQYIVLLRKVLHLYDLKRIYLMCMNRNGARRVHIRKRV